MWQYILAGIYGSYMGILLSHAGFSAVSPDKSSRRWFYFHALITTLVFVGYGETIRRGL